MKKATIMLIAALIGLSACKPEPESLWGTGDAYLGQTPPTDTPKIFAPGLLADSGAFAGDRVAFSANGKEFYYSQNTSWFDSKNLKLKYIKFADGKWGKPSVITEHYYGPTFSSDDKTIYLMGGENKKPGADIISRITRTGIGWSAPVPYRVWPYRMYDFIPTKSGNIYAGSNGNWGTMDWKNCQFAKINAARGDSIIKSLGQPVNSPGFNGDFFIAPDESYMIISAKEHPDFECELWITFHKPDDTWTNPKSLGPLINNDLAHRWGEYVSPDGKYLFYTHGHSAKDCYIYWVRFDRIYQNLKHTNFEPYVKNLIPAQTTRAGRLWKFKLPGDTFVDDDGSNTLTYSAINLPAGLALDAATLTLSGRPSAGKYEISVTATDNAKANAIAKFTLNVEK
ncbi:MAG: putative Ig domain-containing protein [Mucilaginibacter sp.]